MADYNVWLKQHLAEYKEGHLDVAEPGIFSYRKRDISYRHILPRRLHKLNIIETYRDRFWQYFSEHSEVNLHRYFHHLNSSQAMCFNLFYPFCADNQEPLLLDVLGWPDEEIEDHAFEKVLNVEERTNFDFHLRLQSGAQIFFELKLSESEFGKARDDAEHRKKLKTWYHAHLIDKVAPAHLEPTLFFQNYQLLRNISYLQHDTTDKLVLIFPRRNTSLIKKSDALLANVSASIRSRIKIIHLEDFIGRVLREVGDDHTALRSHYQLFREKYIGKMPDSGTECSA